ncbi:MAG: DegT/DnrJ/EryC1/StrS family aminotransferase [Mycobacteriales bacterium]
MLAIDGGTPVRSEPLDPRRGANRIGIEEEEAVLRVLRSRSLFRYYGPDLQHTVDGLEAAVTHRFGTHHALAVSSGTAALRAGLAALGVGPGDEVVVPAVTFIATVNAVVVSGAVPVFCEVDASLGMDPSHLSALVTERTRAIMPVHLENVVCDMDGVLAAAGNIPVLEDACQSMGASYHGRPAGTLGSMGAFSLQLEKNITAGEGGVLVTDDAELHARAARYSDQGGQFVTAHRGTRGGDDAFVGENLRMTELTGAVAGVQLSRLDGILHDLRANKAKLTSLIGPREGLTPRWVPDPDGDCGSSLVWYLPSAELSRKVTTALVAEGIPSGRVYDGQPVYANRSVLERRTVSPNRSPWTISERSYARGMCPRSEDLVSRAAAVLIGPDWTASDLDDVATAIDKVCDALL